METPWDKEVLIRRANKYAPVAATVVGCLLTGSLINGGSEAANEEVVAGLDFGCYNIDQNATTFNNATTIQTLIIVLSTLLPILPLTALDQWSGDKTNQFLSHALGQSSNFASAEVVRHFLVSPNQEFFHTCNLTSERCTANTPRRFQLVAEANSTKPILCPQVNKSFLPELLKNLHSNPDLTLWLVVSATLSFLANVALWKNKKTINPYFKASVVVVFLVYVALTALHTSQEMDRSPADSILAIMYGAVVQYFIFMFYQFKKKQPVYQSIPAGQDYELQEKNIVKTVT